MKEFLLEFYGYTVFFYSLALILSYAVLAWLAEISILRSKRNYIATYTKRIMENSPYTPGVSIIAPAYNEEKTIVDNVYSLLAQDYPQFEVIIVNDGSTDSTLEKLINEFQLVEVPYAYVERIHTRPFRRLLKSTNPEFFRLIVVDKENGGTKADPVNAGLNASSYPWFINMDADCILSRDAVYQCVLRVLYQNDVIAVSGAIAISNGCKIEKGEILEHRPPHSPAPLFQTLEYMRSYLVGKLGWSTINAMPNVSGGYGLFKRDVCIAAGGYSPDSFAEDMDMLIRMISYCCEFKKPYRVIQIPVTCCWTEGPSTLRILYRQRIRWGRGLIQTFSRHRRAIFNRKYKRMGLITLPWVAIFELIAPVIEGLGMVTFIYLAFTGGVNWHSALVMFLAIYTFCFALSLVVIFYDYTLGGSFRKFSSYLWLVGASLLEPFLYHPLIVLFSLKGYCDYIVQSKAVWGVMTRKGTTKNHEKKVAAA